MGSKDKVSYVIRHCATKSIVQLIYVNLRHKVKSDN